MVGVAGFEPAASCSQGTRANQAALHPEHAVYKTLAEKMASPKARTACLAKADGVPWQMVCVRLSITNPTWNKVWIFIPHVTGPF